MCILNIHRFSSVFVTAAEHSFFAFVCPRKGENGFRLRNENGENLMNLVNPQALATFNDFTHRIIYEGVINQVARVMDINKKKQGELVATKAIYESSETKVNVNKADIVVDNINEKLGDLQEQLEKLEKLYNESVKAFEKDTGVRFYKWNKSISREQNILAKKATQAKKTT